MGVVPLFLIYGLILLSGWRIAHSFSLPGRLLRMVMAFTFGCAQLLLSIQCLSLFGKLDYYWLLGANGLATAIVTYWTKGFIQRRLADISHDLPPEKTELGFGGKGMLTIAVGALAFAVVADFLVFPAADPYHFVMGLLWRQQQSLLPQPGPDPRALGIVFAAEGLTFPSVLYAHSWAVFTLLSAIALVLSSLLILALSRSLGAATAPARFAGSLFAACTFFNSTLFAFKPEILLSAMWFLASVLCLFEAHRLPAHKSPLLGCGVICFSMSCGAKNVALLHAPVLVTIAFLLLGRSLFTPRRLAILSISGLFGLAASSVAWSYVTNRVWFGSWRGHSFLAGTISHDMTFNGIWTRWCRGVISLLFDPTWVPSGLRDTFGRVCNATIRFLGGSIQLPEDGGFYSMTWRGGLGIGPVSLFVILPACVAAVALVTKRDSTLPAAERARLRALLLLGITSAFLFFTLLKNQSIGVARLMGTCMVLFFPLCALLFERRLFRIAAYAVTVWSLLFAVGVQANFAVRRHNFWPDSPVRKALASFQKAPPFPVWVRWANEEPVEMQFFETFSRRESYQVLFQRMPKQATIGIIAGYNAEWFYCFGGAFSNTVISLNDCRDDAFLEILPSIEYIIVEDFDAARIPPGFLKDFDSFLTVKSEAADLLLCYRRRSMAPGD